MSCRFAPWGGIERDGSILEAYPDLEAEDIRQALHFAVQAVQERELPLAPAS
ncbi:MAG: DUF433 domain-containing protein [bacterium]|nr:DUF433 domain-containing protein [bacterium]